MKKLNINKERVRNVAEFIGGMTLLICSAHVNNNKVVWNGLLAVPGELLIVHGLLSEGERTALERANKPSLNDVK